MRNVANAAPAHQTSAKTCIDSVALLGFQVVQMHLPRLPVHRQKSQVVELHFFLIRRIGTTCKREELWSQHPFFSFTPLLISSSHLFSSLPSHILQLQLLTHPCNASSSRTLHRNRADVQTRQRVKRDNSCPDPREHACCCPQSAPLASRLWRRAAPKSCGPFDREQRWACQ